MRFQKSIRICKGLKLNISKSGVSATVGVKGLSLNLGKKGVFLYTGIPGTGLSDRRKLFGGAKKPSRNAQQDLEAAENVNAENEMVETLFRLSKRAMPLGRIEPAENVESAFEAFLNALELPVEFNAQYCYDAETGNMLVDLDLPEIEDLPDQKAVTLASGAVRIKPKTAAEKYATYQKCVFGLAILFADGAFLSSRGISKALVSGYTQRRNARTGESEDQYVFSVQFNREAFNCADFGRIDPIAFVQQFRNRMNPLASGALKAIQPYTAEEMEEHDGNQL